MHLKSAKNYLSINRKSWNRRTEVHFNSDFYDVPKFLKGTTSLKNIELELLEDLKDKTLLHLQCHFGQDTISLARLGAKATGIDLSEKAIEKANELTQTTRSNCKFICCDLYDLPQHLNRQFDIVYTSYGTIAWLPDLDKWASIISSFLKPGGRFYFVEFHPVVWMYDDNFTQPTYRYFNSPPIIETESGTYADKSAKIEEQFVCWNHGIGEVVTALIKQGLIIEKLKEYDYSPYNVFPNMECVEEDKYRIKKFKDLMPLVYAVVAKKQE